MIDHAEAKALVVPDVGRIGRLEVQACDPCLPRQALLHQQRTEPPSLRRGTDARNHQIPVTFGCVARFTLAQFRRRAVPRRIGGISSYARCHAAIEGHAPSVNRSRQKLCWARSDAVLAMSGSANWHRWPTERPMLWCADDVQHVRHGVVLAGDDRTGRGKSQLRMGLVLLVRLNRFAAAFLQPFGKHELHALDEREHKRGSERGAKPCPPATEQRGDTARGCDREHDRDER